ncbi:hypothetical protein PA3_10680 [Acinetobacter pittii]|uniref:Uncharacterized protein n=1 Tax=Acinetobacter pittii TaxID=48296 RepID=A0A4Y3J871_ACIPI|nr:hypothetical protein PA3_10680 [Acinetobacter pittii]
MCKRKNLFAKKMTQCVFSFSFVTKYKKLEKHPIFLNGIYTLLQYFSKTSLLLFGPRLNLGKVLVK